MSTLLLAIFVAFVAGAEPAPPSAFEREIQAFETQDKLDPAPREGVLFLGSSSIRLWNLKKYFPGAPVLNRGFGGSRIVDSIHFFGRAVKPYSPKTIVFYAGDNDIAADKSADEVFTDFQTLLSKIESEFPETKVYFIAIKPSPARWELWPIMREANAKIEALADTEPSLEYVDVATPMLGSDGKPVEANYAPDKLHLSPAGYALWSDILRPLILELNPAPAAAQK